MTSKKLLLAGAFALSLSSAALAQQVTPPQIVTFVPAEYPPAAQAAGIEAEVILELTIEADGKVSKATIFKSAGYGFDEAAIAAALQFVFQPATKDGAPVKATVPYRYKFNLSPKGKQASPQASPLDAGLGQPAKELLSGADLLDALPPGELRGLVLERGARSLVPNAQVVVIQRLPGTTKDIVKEALADEKGRFVLPGLIPGEATIKILANEYQTLTVAETIPAEGALEVTLRLTPTVEQGYGLVVRGEKEEQEVTRRVVTADELAKLPGTRGDVLKGLQDLPGFARAPLDSGLLVVRGSAPQDTQTFLNGMPIPLIYHFGGLTSVVSGDLLTQINFLPGVFSARYGRGMGGIIDAETQPGKNNEFHGSVKSDVLDTGVYVQGPLGDSGGSFAVAGRRSYIDVVLPVGVSVAERVSGREIIDDSGLSLTVAPFYWDYQASAGNNLWGGKGQVIAFGSNDRLELVVNDPSLGEQFFASETGFHRVQGIWSKDIAPGLTQRVAVATGVTKLSFESPPIFTFNIDTVQSNARVDWASKITDKLGLTYGLDLQQSFFDVRILFPGENNTTLQTEIEGNNLDAAIYTEAKYSPIDGVLIIPGMRLDYFGLTDSFTVDPRFAARWAVNLKTTLKAGAGLFHQPPQPQEVSEAFGNPDINPQVSEQVTFGLEQKLWKDRLSLDTSVYYKHLSDLVTQNGTGNSIAELTTNDGEGRVRGLEVLLRYPPGPRFFGWLAYSLSKAERKAEVDGEFELFDFDQTHVVTALASYKVILDFTVGARFRYSTGLPETPLTGGIYDADGDFYIPISGTEVERVPAFHQLDIRVDKTFRKDRYTINAYLEVQNVYNRKNPEATFYNFDFTQRSFFNGLPILPVVGVRGEF